MTNGIEHDISHGSKTNLVTDFSYSFNSGLTVGVEELERDFFLHEILSERDAIVVVVGGGRWVVGDDAGEGGEGFVGELVDEEDGQLEHSINDVSKTDTFEPKPKGHDLESFHGVSAYVND